jgi:hypothetical protein
MDHSLPWDERPDASSVHILFPPEDLKPRGDFNRLLSEYQLWIRHNYDRGYSEFLRAMQEMDLSENTSWEIRQTLRRMEKGVSIPNENHTLKWHLILHLARKIEEDQFEAEEMLNHLKKQKSPLEEALGEGSPVQGLLGDLSLTEPQALMGEYQLIQIFEAWIGLFGEYLPNYGPLISIDPQVMNFVIDIFEEQGLRFSEAPKETLPPELSSNRDHITLKYLPQLSDDDNFRRDPVASALSGKTIILFEN